MYRKFSLLLVILLSANVFAQFDKYNSEFEWFTIKGKNVEVHFHDGAERTARVVLKIAEEVWDPVCSLYDYYPDKVHYVIKDIDDYSNGATYFFDNKIEIWTSALDFDLRGSHNWLRNVISHEFTHMVQIQASFKTTRSVPAVYLQVLNYEDKRRPDILYGFPNVIASYPLATLNMPAWFAEGTAQYMRTEFNYDFWDSHRDMILRSYVLDSTMLTWNQMGVFEKTSLGNESVYNSGFALTKYISQKYGEDKLMKLTKALGKLSNFTFDAAAEDILGINGNQLYSEWSAFLRKDYGERIAPVLSNKVAGEMVGKEGFGNFYPSVSKDGQKVFYISNKTSDYFSPTALYEYDVVTKTEKVVVPGVRSTYSMIPGTEKIIYSKLSDDNPYDYKVHDIYVFDRKTEKETRLTYNLRANMPSVSFDGNKITFLFQKDGTTNVGLLDIDGKNFKQLTFYANGEQVYNPKFSADSKSVIFDLSYHHGRDIATVPVDGGPVEFVLKTDSDERSAAVTTDGKLIYSSDETGIFNIYSFELSSKLSKRLSNVTGGAFMPAVDSAGNIVYAGYTSGGYKIFHLPLHDQSSVDQSKYYVKSDNPPLNSNKPVSEKVVYDWERLKKFNDYDYPDTTKTKYSGAFSRLSIFPFVRYDNYSTTNNVIEKIKPGLYVSSSDMLNRFSIFAGGSINLRGERDLFLSVDYRNKLPLLPALGLFPDLGLEIYNVTRKADVDIIFDELPKTSTNVIYNLFEVDIIAKHKLFSTEKNLELRYVYSSYTASIESFIIPNSTDLYPTFNDTYLIGSNFRATYKTDVKIANKDMDINPIGSGLEIRYDYEMNRFNPDGEYTVDEGLLVAQYKNFDFHRLELNTHYSIETFKGHSLGLKLRAGTIFGPSVPDFFDFFLGGLIGMKAYPFYAISGNELVYANLTYRLPLFRDIDYKFGHLYLDKIYLSVFGDLGNAWTGNLSESGNLKKGAGAELRFALNSFYLFPTAVFFSAAYGFDEVTKTAQTGEVVRYGKEWNFYGGVLFGFDL
ncbi:MAG: PD40 domain-containing protein [Ignavibacteriales bacterium]|nr:PD40 domain-containing protein [Ignavibacteriales bacterium]